MNLEKWRAELAGASVDEDADGLLLSVEDALAILERACAEERAEALAPLIIIEQKAASILQSMCYLPPWGESAYQFSTLIQGLGAQLDAPKAALAAAKEKP